MLVGFAGHGSCSPSRGQRISSRCGAVKSVLCPKRLVTVERPPAIRVYLSVQQPCSRERSHPAPPPTPVPALAAPPCASAAGWTRAGKACRTVAHWPPRPKTQAHPGGSNLQQPLSRQRRYRKALQPLWIRIPRQTLFLFQSLRPRPPPAEPDGHSAAPQPPSAGLGREAGGAAGPEDHSPPLRPAPSVGLGPEGGSREGRWGPHPSPSPFPARHKPGAASALAPSSPPRQTRPAEAKPLEKAPPSVGLPTDPKSWCGRQPLPVATHA